MTREEAINIVRNIYQTDAEKEALQALIPELAESEDERIRKTLINIVKGACNKYGIKYKGDEITEEKILAYLEKQKEQKPNKQEWSEEEKDKLNSIERLIVNANAHGNYLIGDKEAIDLQHFIRSIVKPTTNLAEWSENDKLHYANVLNALEYVKGCKSDYDKIEAVKSDITWLKSLRPQPHLKPSEEQMKEWALEGEWIWATTPPEKPGKYKVKLRYDTYSAIWNGVKWIDDASGFPIMGVFKWKPIKEKEQ